MTKAVIRFECYNLGLQTKNSNLGENLLPQTRSDDGRHRPRWMCRPPRWVYSPCDSPQHVSTRRAPLPEGVWAVDDLQKHADSTFRSPTLHPSSAIHCLQRWHFPWRISNFSFVWGRGTGTVRCAMGGENGAHLVALMPVAYTCKFEAQK